MAFNKQEQEIIKWGLANGKSQQEVTQAITNFRTGVTTKPKETAASGGGLGDTIAGAFQGGLNQASEGYNQAKNATNPLQLLEGGTKLAAGAINTALSPLAPITKPLGDVINNPSPDSLMGHLVNSPTFQKFAGSNAGELASRIAEDINNLNTVAGAVAGVKVTPKVGGAIADTTTRAASALGDATGSALEKISPVVKTVVQGRDAKLLSIFSGESTDVVNAAIKDPAVADLGIRNGDVALRTAVQQGADSSIKARQTFTQAYSNAFDTLVKDNPGKIATRQKVLYQFVDNLTNQGVKVKNGKLDFSTSKIVANPGEVGKINSAYQAIQKWSDFSLKGTNQLKQLVGQLTKFATEQGGSSKSPFLGRFYNYLDTTIKDALPETSKKAYTDMNAKFSSTIGLYDDMVSAFNSGDPFTKLSQLFGANKDTLRQVIDFYEKTTGNKISPIVAGRTLAQEKSAAFGFLNPRSWVDFFIPPKLQAELVTGYGKLKGQSLKSALKSTPIESGTTTPKTQIPKTINKRVISPKSTIKGLKVKK